jgi:hypothetical protein
MPFIPPFATPPPGTQTLPCARCGHVSTYHHGPTAHHVNGCCRFRLTWRHLWRRCPCEGYAPPGALPEPANREPRQQTTA